MTMPPADDEPTFAHSVLSQRLTRHGVTVQVEIYEDGEGKWILEVVDAQKASHVWDDHFESDHQALAEAIRALEEETVESMAAPAKPDSLH